MVSLLIAAALFAGAEPAAAAKAPAAAQPTVSTLVVEAQEKPERKPGPKDMVCRKEAVLGSRMPKRTCQLQADWEQRRVDDRDLVDRSQTNLQGYR